MTTYATVDFETKKALKDAVASGRKVHLINLTPMGDHPIDGPGKHFVSGPHYPRPHKWYAECITDDDGNVIKVK